jgi:hypothetical protein
MKIRLALFLLPVTVGMLVSCTATGGGGQPVVARPKQAMRPYFAGYGQAVPRVGAVIDNNPRKNPGLSVPLGGRQGGPPYGKAVGDILGATFKKSGIPGADGQQSNPKFTLVATIQALSPAVRNTSSGPSATAPFSLSIRDIHGKQLSQDEITGSAPVQSGQAPAMANAIGDAANQIATRLCDSSHLQRLLGWPSTRVTSADVAVKNGAERFRAMDYAGSLGWFREAIAIDPNHQSAWAYHGASLMKLAKTEEAKRSLERAVSLDPESAEGTQARKWLDRLK